MTPAEIGARLRDRISRALAPRFVLRRVAYHLNAWSLRFFPDAYREGDEAGPQNLAIKLERQAQGGPFEPWSIALINTAACGLLAPGGSVLEVGCGTGMFASLAARDASRRVTASEQDAETLVWAKHHRGAPNIEFCDRRLEDFDDDAFDVAVAIELIEHVADYAGFLSDLSRVAPRAIVTTPNKNRSPFDAIANTPAYHGHVREWTAGEFFWVLRSFYGQVELFTIADFPAAVERLRRDPGFVPSIERCSVLSHREPLLASCSDPQRRVTP